jgi:hypothetical protein
MAIQHTKLTATPFTPFRCSDQFRLEGRIRFEYCAEQGEFHGTVLVARQWLSGIDDGKGSWVGDVMGCGPPPRCAISTMGSTQSTRLSF